MRFLSSNLVLHSRSHSHSFHTLHTQDMTTVPPSAAIPLEERPASERFTLPDHTPIAFAEAVNAIQVRLGRVGDKAAADEALAPLASFKVLSPERKARVSLHGAVNEDRAKHEAVWELVGPKSGEKVELKPTDAWAALYACELLLHAAC